MVVGSGTFLTTYAPMTAVMYPVLLGNVHLLPHLSHCTLLDLLSALTAHVITATM